MKKYRNHPFRLCDLKHAFLALGKTLQSIRIFAFLAVFIKKWPDIFGRRSMFLEQKKRRFFYF